MSTTLLAVDDSVTMRKVLEITFNSEEYRIITADSPDAALKIARNERPALCLFDVTLPGMDGYALCEAFKKEFPGIPVLILSSKQRPYDATRGTAFGVDEYADKPFDTQQLLDKVKRVLQAKAAAPKVAEPLAAPAPKPGGSTIPGAAPIAPSPLTSRQSSGQTSNFSSSDRAATGGHIGTAKPMGAEARSRTATGLGIAASQAQSQAQKPTQPAIPAQISPTPKPSPVGPAPVVEEVAPPAVALAAASPAVVSPVAAAVNGEFGNKLSALGLSPTQADAVLALSREVVERIVWEVVPVLAETLIKEEIKRLTSE